MGLDSPICKKWQQVDLQFGFVPLGSQIIPDNPNWCHFHSFSPIQMHEIVRSTGNVNS